MAVTATGVQTLNDVLSVLDPQGKLLDIAEILTQDNEFLDYFNWREGNLVTGHRDAARTALPTPSFRAINEGVPVTKGASTQIEETCALLEDFSQCDRELAILSGNIAGYRLQEGKPHIIGMGHKMAQQMIYGNAAADPKSFTGLAPRYNSLSTSVSNTANNVLNAGGTGSALRSIWLIVSGPDTITGLYPKNTKGGLLHEDATSHAGGTAENGGGQVMLDANGNPYIGFRDHWLWRCGMMVKDWRYAVRIANIDPTTLTKSGATGADIQDLMIQAAERVQDTSNGRAFFLMDRNIRAFFRRQLTAQKNQFLSMDDVGGKRMLNFGEIPILRTDAMAVNEAQVS
ncbi:MAG TPA: hypothetical protein VF638_14280 [Sphingomonas sp.]|jgi:hypothetical protein